MLLAPSCYYSLFAWGHMPGCVPLQAWHAAQAFVLQTMVLSVKQSQGLHLHLCLSAAVSIVGV